MMKKIGFFAIAFVMLLMLGAWQFVSANQATAGEGVGSSEKTVQTDSKSGQQGISTDAKNDTAQKSTNSTNSAKVATNSKGVISGQDKQVENDLALKAKETEKNDNSGSQKEEKTQTQYKIDVSLKDQCVRIYSNGKLIKNFTVSTGTDDSTPKGDFEIQNRGEWFFSGKYQEGAKWWVSFKGWGEYLFHSIPMNQDQQILTEEADKLGSPASHGCIRLAIENAKWIYDNIPQGTTVHIE